MVVKIGGISGFGFWTQSVIVGVDVLRFFLNTFGVSVHAAFGIGW